MLLVAALAIQRLWEVRVSQRNEAAIKAAGGREHAAGHFALMKTVHGLWMLGMVFEVWLLDRPFSLLVAVVSGAIVLVGQSLRYAAIWTLGRRWTVRIMTIPGAPPVRRGIYRFVRHPNYLGVILEIAAFPMIHGAYLTAILGSLANALVLVVRIRCEEQALGRDNRYDESFGHQPRFVPWSHGDKVSRP